MSRINDGGPAFPTPWQNTSDGVDAAPTGEVVPRGCTIQIPGMSLRDFLAATTETPRQEDFSTVQQEALAGRQYPNFDGATHLDRIIWEAEWRAAWRHMQADAMLKVRREE